MIGKAMDLDTARGLVQKAADAEHELYVRVCKLIGVAPSGKRGYTQLHDIAGCLIAIKSHESKIQQHQSVLVNNDKHLKEFNEVAKRLGLISNE
jgi:hypothetical protein